MFAPTSRFVLVVSTFIACTAVAACSGTKPAAPTAPTPKPAPSGPISALSLSAPPAAIKVGDTFQLTATATFSNGQSATSGFDVTWTSSDTSVATVSAIGLVTAKAEGFARVFAFANAISARTDLLVSGRRLSGSVVMAPAAAFLSVPGARVTVTDGPYSGTSVTADADGHFTLSDVDGVLPLRVSAPGFDDSQVTGDTASRGIMIEMTRSDHPVADVARWSVPYGDARQVHAAEMTFGLRSSGRVDLSTSAFLSSGESAPLCSELRDDDNRLLWSQQTIWQGVARTTLTLESRRRYTLKINDCKAGRPTMYDYQLFAIHPA